MRGIPENQKNRVFDRFFQVEACDPRSEGAPGHRGTGIGLSLAKEIVRLHKGRIHVESKEGAWAMFMVELPLNQNMPDSEPSALTGDEGANGRTALPAQVFQHPETDGVQYAGETILIVEDNPDMRSFLKSILEKTYQLVTAHDGKAALSILEKTTVDLVLTDLMMPGMEGFELIKRIRQKGEAIIPIIILSAKTDIRDRIKGFETGANDYMVKPFSPGELLARIRSHLKLRQLKELLSSTIQPVRTGKRITGKTKEKIRIVEEFINENFMDHLTRDQLAFAVDMSPDHLGRSFKQQTGQRISDYLNRLRIDQAKKELVQTDKKVIDIAFEVGFESLRTFNKAFRNYENTTPSGFRKEERTPS